MIWPLIFRPKAGRYGMLPTFLTAALGSLTANATTTSYVPSPKRKLGIERVTYAASTPVADADGTVLLTLTKVRASDASTVVLVNGADLETIAADTATELPLVTGLTRAQRTMLEGDVLKVTIVNNSAAINTQHANAWLTVEAGVLE